VPRVLADFDRPQNLNIVALWEPPFGRGRVFGGWQLNTVFQYLAGTSTTLTGAVLAGDPRLKNRGRSGCPRFRS